MTDGRVRDSGARVGPTERVELRRSIGAYRHVKRGVDWVAAAALLVLLSPLLLAVALVVRLALGSPVLFVQTRSGRDGEPFRLLKFRTMRDAVGPDGRPLPDAERMTAVGRVLRATSLDELPGLVNVLRGEMSLVGPRPLLAEYLPRYSARQRLRHAVRPGITGLAQVSGRNAVSWEERLELDVRYVERLSPWLDLSILVRTVPVVLGARGVRLPGRATMEPFRGVGETTEGGTRGEGPPEKGEG